jgi:hypothetical protein
LFDERGALGVGVGFETGGGHGGGKGERRKEKGLVDELIRRSGKRKPPRHKEHNGNLRQSGNWAFGIGGLGDRSVQSVVSVKSVFPKESISGNQLIRELGENENRESRFVTIL